MQWTFDQAENVACFTLRQIVEDGAPVLLVVHDLDDHGWQFLTGASVSVDDAMIVSMREVVDLDSTLLEVGHILPGCQATRQSIGTEWQIQEPEE
ncbi:MAG: hypothetical protein QNJ19_15745 [Woeseiaceae bacterium]|nr:hypothetical protein [Woeseiaceae bacterium]